MLPAVTRPESPISGDERTLLTSRLDYQRSTMLWKCESLDGDALARRGMAPSSLSLLGLVRHATCIEWYWFAHVFAGAASPPPISLREDPDADFNDLRPGDAMVDIDRFTCQCDESRRIVAASPDVDCQATSKNRRVSLRWIMLHMIEEYARHNGHADLLREQIDGTVGA